MIKRRFDCRVCKSRHLTEVADFGMTPLANNYITDKELDLAETFYPLQVNACDDCGNIQLAHVVDPSLLFKEYLYVSSTSPVFVKHFEDFAKEYVKEFHPKDIIDIGGNDGILLKPFEKLGCEVLNIDPAENIESQIPTMRAFFSLEVARDALIWFGQADLITATNVFAHIDDLDDVVEGVKVLLAENGQFMVEVCNLDQMLESGTFDLIYHEHLNYWTEQTLKTFFELRGMKVVKVEHIPVHGGSLRVYARISK
jgi:hypothetical protein